MTGPRIGVALRTGFAADGRIRFQDAVCDGLLGAYADIGIRVIAVGIKSSATTGASCSIVRLHHDGSVTVLAGTSELGVAPERIAVVMGDTGTVPFGLQTSAGRSTREVEVDPETGETRILRHVSVSDVGRALNPAHVAAQDEGAAIMGLGHTLMEHLLLDGHGRIRNPGALDDRISHHEGRSLGAAFTGRRERGRSRSARRQGRGRGWPVRCRAGRRGRGARGRRCHDPRPAADPERVWRAINDRSTPGEADERRP